MGKPTRRLYYKSLPPRRPTLWDAFWSSNLSSSTVGPLPPTHRLTMSTWVCCCRSSGRYSGACSSSQCLIINTFSFIFFSCTVSAESWNVGAAAESNARGDQGVQVSGITASSGLHRAGGGEHISAEAGVNTKTKPGIHSFIYVSLIFWNWPSQKFALLWKLCLPNTHWKNKVNYFPYYIKVVYHWTVTAGK